MNRTTRTTITFINDISAMDNNKMNKTVLKI